MAVNSRVKAVTCQRFDTAGLTGGYDLMNAGGLDKSCFYIKIINDSNTDVEISYDAVGTHDFVPNGTSQVLNLQSNYQPAGAIALMPKGQEFYLLGQGGVGYIYLIGYYQE